MREVASHAMLGQDLLAEGILLTRYEERRQRLPGATLLSALFTRVPILEKLLFARYFALMLRAGLDVKRSLSALSQQTRSKPMKAALEHVLQGVERGDTLADSMATYYLVFPPLFVSFVRVGESTGRLQESLEILAAQLQKEFELIKAKKDAEIEVAKAEGVAKSNSIIANSITDNYLRYKWVEGLQRNEMQVIYVPTEANLPIMEAGRLDEYRKNAAEARNK